MVGWCGRMQSGDVTMEPSTPDNKSSSTTDLHEPFEETRTPGLRPARAGCQPVKDLAAFLGSLPEFGPDAATLRAAIAEDRALRRALAQAEDC